MLTSPTADKIATMNFCCEEHDQRDWDCYQEGEKTFHLMKPPQEWRNSGLKLKQVRCLGCMCKHMDKQTEEIDFCEYYTK